MEAILIALALVVFVALAIKVFKTRSELREQQAVYDRAKQNEHIADVNAMREHALADALSTRGRPLARGSLYVPPVRSTAPTAREAFQQARAADAKMASQSDAARRTDDDLLNPLNILSPISQLNPINQSSWSALGRGDCDTDHRSHSHSSDSHSSRSHSCDSGSSSSSSYDSGSSSSSSDY